MRHYLSQQHWGLSMCLPNSKLKTIKNKSFYLEFVINLWNLLPEDIARSIDECKKAIKYYHRGYFHLCVMSPVLQTELPVIKFLKIPVI